MKRFAYLAVCLGLASGSARAVSPNPKDLAIPHGDLLRARSLIPQLGSDVFQERESAERELARMGRFAGPVLREAAIASRDPEVRVRAARLLPRADAAELKARTEAFLADAEGKYEHAMPGWLEFRHVACVDHVWLGLKLGTDTNSARQARELFVEMLKSKPTTALLTAISNGSGEDLAKAAAERRLQMWMDMNPGAFGGIGGANTTVKPPTIADFTALLFTEVLLEGKTTRTGPVHVTTSQFFHSAAIRPVLQGTGPHAAVSRRILAAWFNNLTDINELQQVAYQVIQFNMKEALPAMRRAITAAGTPQHLRAQAIGAIAKLGGKEELPRLRKLLTDETVVQANRFPNKMDLQVRDVALAMCLVVTGQEAKTYGYEIQQPLNEQIKYQYWTFAFRTPEKRAEALKKWAEWEKAQAEKEKK